MGLFKAKGGSFVRLPEGLQVLGIKEVKYDVDFFTETSQMVEVVLENEAGINHTEKFNFANSGGAKILTYLIKCVFNDFSIKEGDDITNYIDTMAGRFFESVVVWENAVDKDGNLIKTKKDEQVINVKLTDRAVTEKTFEFEYVESIVENDEDDEDEDDEETSSDESEDSESDEEEFNF